MAALVVAQRPVVAFAVPLPHLVGVLRLPIDDVLPALCDAVRARRAVVLQAPPGAGKTTRVPLALRDAGLHLDERGRPGEILVLEPRRVAARAAATTLARQLGQDVGGTVGYQVRFEKRVGARTEIVVVTEGILTRRFASDPLLEDVRVVVLDEFHERSIHTDLCLAFVRELMEVRDDLAVVVMSATLDAAAVSSYLHDCPIVTSAGRPYPVRIQHVDKRDDRYLDERMAGAIRNAMVAPDDDGGDVLCFLPGSPEIRRVQERLSERALPADARGPVDVVPLFGALSPAEQDRALLRGPRRKVILATNVAETSLTIEGVTTVIDSGVMKQATWDAATDESSLDVVRISRASAEQRAGRAGRTGPGRCVRLWTATEHAMLADSHAPEIARAELTGPLLDVLAFHPGDPSRFAFFEPPPSSSLARASSLLRLLGAIDDAFRVTPRGQRLAQLPLSPRAAAVLVQAALEGVVDEAAIAVSLLQEERTRERGEASTTTDSDLALQIERFEELRERRLLRGAMVDVKRNADDLLRIAERLPQGSLTTTRARALKRALFAGFPDRVCRRRRAGEPDAAMVGGRGARLDRASGVRDATLFLALSLQSGTGARSSAAPSVSVAEAIDEELLREVRPDLVRTEDEAVFDEERGAFVGVRRTRFADLVLVEKTGVPVNAEAVSRALAATCAERFSRVFKPDDDAQRLRDRIRFARRVLPDVVGPSTGGDVDGLPAVEDDDLKAWLPELCVGRRSIDDVMKLDWRRILFDRVPWRWRAVLDEDVPERIEVPTGNSITLDYAPTTSGQPPVLAVRLQELFGLVDTPRIARGRVPVLLHLLSPGYKPVQVTGDLKSFWSGAYHDVKKELRARYPKHSWPDDPFAATPTDRARRRGH